MKNIFVTLEGVDGVGKTEVAKLIAAEGSFQYYKSPGGLFSQLRKEVDIHASPLERYCFYKLATQSDSVLIKQLLKKTSIICDRYITSTAAYHIAMDPRIRTIHDDLGILKPHFSFLLGAQSEIRDKRILERAEKLADVNIEKNSKLLDHIAKIFLSFGLIYIDTSNITSIEVVKKINCIISKKRRAYEPKTTFI